MFRSMFSKMSLLIFSPSIFVSFAHADAVKLGERMWKIEGLFSEAKVNHCLNRANNRGIVKVQIQAYMIGMVQNLKRLLVHAGSILEGFIFEFLTVRQFQFLN